MSAQPIHSPRVMPKPARTPAAIRAVLVNAGEQGLVERFDAALDCAYTEAREANSLEPLNEMLTWWWAESISWCDPAKHKAFLAKVEGWRVNGIPDSERANPDDVLAILEAKGASRDALDKLRSLAARR
ncbi:DUF6247 family protein [Catenulispora acidiphila]|nr:DUF6247 family protein [Catenulispora acidiphila]